MKLGISVIICCYNSIKRLPETLRHLALQEVSSDLPWEIVVIDNASTDNTAQLAQEEWNKYDSYHVGFQVTKQPLQGLVFAKEMGVNAANYEYLVFCDDDNWLSSNYISNAFKIMQSNGQIGVLGGHGVFEPEQPFWSEIEQYKTLYATGSQRWAVTEHWVYGAGSVYRKSLLLSLKSNGWQHITSGRVGNKLISGEDVELCFMCFLTGYQIVYDDRLLFKHFVPLKRQNINYILNLHFGLSYTNVLLNSYFAILNKEKNSIEKITGGWLRAITKTIIKQYISFLYKIIKTGTSVSIEEKIQLKSNLGTFSSLFKNRKKIIAHHLLIKKILLKVETSY